MVLSYSKYALILPLIKKICNSFSKTNAAVVKLADALDSKSSGLILRVGSSPTSGTNKKRAPIVLFFLLCVNRAELTNKKGSRKDFALQKIFGKRSNRRKVMRFFFRKTADKEVVLRRDQRHQQKKRAPSRSSLRDFLRH